MISAYDLGYDDAIAGFPPGFPDNEVYMLGYDDARCFEACYCDSRDDN